MILTINSFAHYEGSCLTFSKFSFTRGNTAVGLCLRLSLLVTPKLGCKQILCFLLLLLVG